jgi:DNA-binding NarL/FixJ family response regulator
MSSRLQIVSKDPLLGEALAIVLDADQRFEVIGHSSDFKLASLVVQHHGPDVLLVDLRGTHGDAEGLVRRALKRWRKLAILVLGNKESLANAIHCLEAGAGGYFSLDGSLQELLRVLERRAAGENVYGEEIIPALLDRLVARADAERIRRRLGTDEVFRPSDRDLQIVELLESGRTNEEIGQEIGRSHHVVKNRLQILGKMLGVAGRTKIAEAAHQRGWIKRPRHRRKAK